MTLRTVIFSSFLTALLLGLTACGEASEPADQAEAVEPQVTSAPATNAATSATEEDSMSATTKVLMKTNKGDITLELNGEKAPLTVANFVQYAEAGHYNGTLFHRVIPGFMVQGGGFEPGMKQKPTQAPVANEANNGLTNEPMTIAMARTNDPHSATSQFFINVANNGFLNFSSETPSGWGYAVFGVVTEGEDVVKAIEQVTTGQVGPYGDVPSDDVVIESVTIME